MDENINNSKRFIQNLHPCQKNHYKFTKKIISAYIDKGQKLSKSNYLVLISFKKPTKSSFNSVLFSFYLAQNYFYIFLDDMGTRHTLLFWDFLTFNCLMIIKPIPLPADDLWFLVFLRMYPALLAPASSSELMSSSSLSDWLEEGNKGWLCVSPWWSGSISWPSAIIKVIY